MINSICFITDAYPYFDTDTRNIFVKRLIHAIAELGVNCQVIAPFFPLKQKNPPYHWVDVSPTLGREIHIFCPRFVSCSNKTIRSFRSARLTELFFTQAVLRTIKKEKLAPEVFYGHFITPAGIAAGKMGQMFGVPSVFAFGESTMSGVLAYGIDAVRATTNGMTCAIAVSSHNKELLVQHQFMPSEKIGVFPNGTDNKLFHPTDKPSAKKAFGIDASDFTVGYVGAFSQRKGMHFLHEIMQNAQNTMNFLCGGTGTQMPKHDCCRVLCPCPPDVVPMLLNAADVFAFPSAHEGCSNAVVEALSCGLPVVAWALPCHRDILNETNALLIPFGDTDGFYHALCRLRDDVALRARLSQGALRTAEALSLSRRAENILAWLNSTIEKSTI